MGACLIDDNCPGEQKCETFAGELGYCDMGMGGIDGCETDDDCDAGDVCEMGFCAPDFGHDEGCETDEDCADDEICDFGICMPDFDF